MFHIDDLPSGQNRSTEEAQIGGAHQFDSFQGGKIGIGREWWKKNKMKHDQLGDQQNKHQPSNENNKTVV